MRQHIGNGRGWEDAGPRVQNTFDRSPAINGIPEAGRVRVTAGPRYGATFAPYTDVQVAAVVAQGKDNPRPLSLAGAQIATANRNALRRTPIVLEEAPE